MTDDNRSKKKWSNASSLLQAGVDYTAEDLPAYSYATRTYKGTTHTVFVWPVPSGSERRLWWRYMYEGVLYKSLSAVARKITGDPTCSGNRFFRLRRRRR
jgi:hypothetical protein